MRTNYKSPGDWLVEAAVALLLLACAYVCIVADDLARWLVPTEPDAPELEEGEL